MFQVVKTVKQQRLTARTGSQTAQRWTSEGLPCRAGRIQKTLAVVSSRAHSKNFGCRVEQDAFKKRPCTPIRSHIAAGLVCP